MASRNHNHADLRGAATDQHRAASSKAKWQPKWAYYDEHIKYGPNNTRRPRAGPVSHRAQINDKHSNEREMTRRRDAVWDEICTDGAGITVTAGMARRELGLPGPVSERLDERLGSPDTDDSFDGDNEDEESGLAPVQVQTQAHALATLPTAVDRALERYEDSLTTRLVRDEYECVPAGAEADDDRVACDDDGFELV